MTQATNYTAGTIRDDQEEQCVRRGPWTVDEDMSLIRCVTTRGEGRWNTVAKFAGLKRTGKSCRLRWLNYLRPDVKRGNITPEEQLLILELHRLWGNRWSKIARQLPGRTDNEIKNYWRTRIKKHIQKAHCDANPRQLEDSLRYSWLSALLQPKGIESSNQSAQAASSSEIIQPSELDYMLSQYKWMSGLETEIAGINEPGDSLNPASFRTSQGSIRSREYLNQNSRATFQDVHDMDQSTSEKQNCYYHQSLFGYSNSDSVHHEISQAISPSEVGIDKDMGTPCNGVALVQPIMISESEELKDFHESTAGFGIQYVNSEPQTSSCNNQISGIETNWPQESNNTSLWNEELWYIPSSAQL